LSGEKGENINNLFTIIKSDLHKNKLLQAFHIKHQKYARCL